jgi:uncharacterized protein DUF5335
MSQTIEIPRNDWARALQRCSATHEGSLVSLDVLAPELGALPEVMNVPLVGVSFEFGHDSVVFVSAGPSPTCHLTHSIPRPTRIWLERADDGSDVALAMESADATRTIVRFTAVAHGAGVAVAQRP